MEEKLNELPPMYKDWWDLYIKCHKKVLNTNEKYLLVANSNHEERYRIDIDYLKARALENILNTEVGYNDLKTLSYLCGNGKFKFNHEPSIQKLIQKFIQLKLA